MSLLTQNTPTPNNPSGGGSKEALPLGGRTVLDWVLDEAFLAGASRAVVVSAPTKSDIEAIVSARKEAVDLMYQTDPLGLAHAVAAAREDEEDALILLPDTVYRDSAASRALGQQLGQAFGAILVQAVSTSEVSSYGIVEMEGERVTKVLEKPTASQTESRMAVAARFALAGPVLRLTREMAGGMTGPGELTLTEVLNRALLHSLEVVALPTEALRYDCGSPAGYAEALKVFGA